MDNINEVVGTLGKRCRRFYVSKTEDLVSSVLHTENEGPIPIVLPFEEHRQYKGQRVVCEILLRMIRKHTAGSLSILTYMSCLSIEQTESADSTYVEIDGVVVNTATLRYTENQVPYLYFDVKYLVYIPNLVWIQASCRVFGDIALSIGNTCAGDAALVKGRVVDTAGGARLLVEEYILRREDIDYETT